MRTIVIYIDDIIIFSIYSHKYLIIMIMIILEKKRLFLLNYVFFSYFHDKRNYIDKLEKKISDLDFFLLLLFFETLVKIRI